MTEALLLERVKVLYSRGACLLSETCVKVMEGTSRFCWSFEVTLHVCLRVWSTRMLKHRVLKTRFQVCEAQEP